MDRYFLQKELRKLMKIMLCIKQIVKIQIQVLIVQLFTVLKFKM